jgi:hypothetical protein
MAVAHDSLTEAPRHVKVTGVAPAFGYEPCEDVGCSVGRDGVADSCKRIACPNCGFGGTNLTTMSLVGSGTRARCTCGHTWVLGAKPVYVSPPALADSPAAYDLALR